MILYIVKIWPHALCANSPHTAAHGRKALRRIAAGMDKAPLCPYIPIKIGSIIIA
jgi:hypothetical protein